MKNSFFLILMSCLVACLSSCYVQHPPYTVVDNVTQLITGIEVDSVNKILKAKPHDLISLDSNGRMILLYKYRVYEIKRVPLIMKKNKGLKVHGQWKDLIVEVSPEGKVVRYDTRVEELTTDREKKKIDPNKLVESLTLALTVIIPSLLVFFSSK